MTGGKITADQAEELARCFAAHAEGLFGYACVLTRGDRALADDLVQSAFMAAALQWPTFGDLHDPQRLRWLRTTIGNLAISTFRRNAAFRDLLPSLDAPARPRTRRRKRCLPSRWSGAGRQCWRCRRSSTRWR